MTTTEPVIRKLLYRLRERYGSRFVIMIGDDPYPEIVARWQKGCRAFTAHDIGKALEKVSERYPKQPPALDEFVKFVKEVKQHKPGHLSNRTWETQDMEKCSKQAGNRHLDKLRTMV